MYKEVAIAERFLGNLFLNKKSFSERVTKNMRDTITIGTIAGMIATVVMALFNLLIRLIGFKFITTWETASNIFLNQQLIHTSTGYFVGLLAQFILGSLFGIAIAYTLRLTGKDFFILKGIGVGAVIWLASVGLFMKLLRIEIQGRSDPLSNIMAVIEFNMMGIISATIIAKYAKFKIKES